MHASSCCLREDSIFARIVRGETDEEAQRGRKERKKWAADAVMTLAWKERQPACR